VSEWSEAHQPTIPVRGFISTLLDLVLTDGNQSHTLLSSTGLFYEDIICGEKKVSVEKAARLIYNCQNYYKGADLAFRLGQRLLAVGGDEFSRTLCCASNLEQALAVVKSYGFILSPLLIPSIRKDSEFVSISWYPVYYQQDLNQFCGESVISALTMFLSALADTHIPWHYEFTDKAPVAIEHYVTHLRGKLQFSRPVTRIRLPIDYMQQTFSNDARLNYLCGMQQLETIRQHYKTGFLVYLRNHIKNRVTESITLAKIADDLSVSKATLKRKLRSHGCSFRELLDDVRMEVAIDLMERYQYTSEQIAEHLGYYDEANYRRSFKRWTGTNPAQYFSCIGLS